MMVMMLMQMIKGNYDAVGEDGEDDAVGEDDEDVAAARPCKAGGGSLLNNCL